MKSRLSATPAYLARSLRFVLVGTALIGSTLIPAVPASASARAALFHVDAPATNTMVSNGAMLDIGGWTAGSRVDVYLDGPAGVGLGIGSAQVIGARPDVAGRIGAELAYSGFDVAWMPLNLSAGAHTLFLYSFIDGEWTFQSLSVIGEGNLLPTERDRDNDRGVDESIPAGSGSDTAVDSGPGTDSGAPSVL